jgi:hypothetical protein
MYLWCLGALQPDGLTHAISVSFAPRLFNPVVLCTFDASGLFNPMVLHMIFLMPRGPLPGGLTHTCSWCPGLFTPDGLKHIVYDALGFLISSGLTYALPKYLSTLVLRSSSIISFILMLNSSYTLLNYFTITFMIMPLTHAFLISISQLNIISTFHSHISIPIS